MRPPAAERLVVRAPNWLGDVVLSLGAVRDLRRNFPAARIEVLAKPSVAPVYEMVAEVDAVRLSAGFHDDVESLAGAFDAGVLLTNSFGTALVLSLAGIPERWGWATQWRWPLLTRSGPVPAAVRGCSQVYYYRAMLAAVGLRVSASCDVSLAPPPEWRASGAALLDADVPFWIGVNPGAAYGTAKRWLPERYAAVADLLHARTGAGVAVVGSADERPVGEAIAAQMDAPVRVLCGETGIPELVGVLASLRLLLTNDSGPMHVAAAVGTPVVAVFGSTDPRETAPRTDRARLVREEVECAPCLLRECPIDHRCMQRIGVDAVLGAADDLLACLAAPGTSEAAAP